MKAISAISTMPAKDSTTSGYIIADLTWRRSESSASSWFAMRWSVSSRMPPVSPARTMAMYRGLKVFGCRSRASESVSPDSMSSRTSAMICLSVGCSICSSST